MRIPDKLKLNKFRLVMIPSTRDIFARFGPREAPRAAFTGEDAEASYPQTKIDALHDAQMQLQEEFDRQREHEFPDGE